MKKIDFNNKARNKLLITALSLVCAAICLAVVYYFPKIGESLDLKFYDFKIGIQSNTKNSPAIVHLDVDDLATQRFGTWPWDRSMSAWILKRLKELGAKAVIFDVLFTSPGKSVEGNNSFFNAIEQSQNFVAATVFRVTDQSDQPLEITTDRERADMLYSRAWKQVVPSDFRLYRVKSLETSFVPLTPILSSAAQVGHIKDIPDRDGVYRRVPMFIQLEDKLVPAVSLATLCVFKRIDHSRITLGNSLQIDFPDENNTIHIPVDSSSMMLVNWGNVWSAFPHYSVIDLLDDEPNEMKAPRYRDKIVVLGVTATGSTDFGITPLEPRSPLSRIHSHAMNTILTGKFITQVPSFPVPALVTFLFTALLVMLTSRTKLRVAILLACLTTVAAVFALIASFVFFSYEISLSAVLIIFVPATAMSLVARTLSVEFDAYKASRALERYLSPELVKEIVESGAEVDLNTKKKDLTIMFVDIQGFSSMSEEVSVEHVNRYLNDFFQVMTTAVFEQKGTVDKFLGDGMLAFFGDPAPLENHSMAALEAALRMQERMKEINARWKDSGIPQLAQGMKIRIGLNSGSVIVGNIGSQRRLEYTVLGSVVNIASRLQSLAPPGGIIMTETTFGNVSKDIFCDGPETVKVKGIDRGIPIYKVFAESIEGICSSHEFSTQK